MPENLALPVELHRQILHSDGLRYEDLWGSCRSVCQTWKADVEHLAKTQWLQRDHWDPEFGKVVLNGDFTFQRLDDDTAVFRITDCAPEFRKPLIKACKRSGPPDVHVDEIVHDVPIDGMSVDWDALTLTCPWRAVIGRVLAEELRVDARRGRSHKKMMTLAKRARARCGGDVDMDTFSGMLEVFGKNYLDAYVVVRRERLGRDDPEGDERLKMARFVAGFQRMRRKQRAMMMMMRRNRAMMMILETNEHRSSMVRDARRGGSFKTSLPVAFCRSTRRAELDNGRSPCYRSRSVSLSPSAQPTHTCGIPKKVRRTRLKRSA
ncbi:hypothetical protein C8F04DRAFT_973990 [Mycena alexandri]|uniref:Uncharacterized protein n=1 Tax=Mycena alexandri TaxID=1745969 RepID=A0AAD6WTR7_9AGAR|nr:hypothetical protein C8F04DRAFT_973990 [Mycena alexandri]